MNALQQQISAVDALAEFAVGLTYANMPEAVRARLSVMIVDLLGVTAAGARTPEFDKLLRSWQCPPGEAPLVGRSEATCPETAAYLNAVAACSLELDEGNKHAQGHPAVQVLFAAMAATQQSKHEISGQLFLTAIAAGYEIAARFGRALHRNAAWHTHGHWGSTGAACAAALIAGATRQQVAAAIDASTALMHVTPWNTVLAGNFVRNFWVAGSNIAGLNAARLAMSGLTTNAGAAVHSLGEIVGSIDTGSLTESLGEAWLVAQGYSKRHSACSYTHAAVDIVQMFKAQESFDIDQIATVRVRTHSLAKPLFEPNPHNRLAAMFSFPFVVSTAILNPSLGPEVMDPENQKFAEANAFSTKVVMEVSDDFDALLPAERWTEVRITLLDGTSMMMSQPNPIGDVDYYPLGAAEIQSKLQSLIGDRDAGQIQMIVAALPGSVDVRSTLSMLRNV